MNKKDQPETVRDTAKLPSKRRQIAGGVYIALTGLNYGDPEKRVEAGEEVSDLPAESIEWLIECGAIKPKEAE